MAMSESLANSILNTNLSTAARWMWLHTGDPGAAGTAAPTLSTVDTTSPRVSITFGAPANDTGFVSEQGRKVVSNSTGVWTATEMAPDQAIKYFSLWTSSAAGSVLFISAVETSKLTGADGVKVASGDITAAIEIFKKSA